MCGESAINGEKRICEGDQDCLVEQYCYDVSKRCVNYTMCIKYNRVEGVAPARDASQCGPCIKGYISDVFATGEAPLCHIKDDARVNYINIIIMVLGTIFALFVLIMLIRFIYINFDKLKNYFSKRCCNWFSSMQSVEINQHISNHATFANIYEETVASAPPEQRPFVQKANCVVPHKSNEVIERNQFQTAVPLVPPNWVRNANYGTNILTYSSDEMDTFEENRRNAQVETVNDNNVEENLSESSEYHTLIGMEHDYDFRSTPLLTTNSPNNSVNGDADNNTNINTNLSSQPNRATNEETNNQEKIKNIFINQSLNQHITMNVNVKDNELINSITN